MPPKTKVIKNKKTIDTLINDLNTDPTLFITDNNADNIIKTIEYAAKKYYNDQSVISDETYDFLIDFIKELDPNHPVLKKVGAKIVSKNKIRLPFYMGSMDKVKPTDSSTLEKWLQTYKGPYVYSDKLDGVSALYMNNKLYTRGDGIEGTDITPYIRYIPTLNNLNKNMKDVAVRGELIISKNNFKKYEEKMANARNMVSGIFNAKKIDQNVVKDVEFIAYELVNPWNTNQLEQWKIIKDYGFKVVNYGSNVQVNFENLSNILIDRKNLSEYEIDGIIVSNQFLDRVRTVNTNPVYAFAFKDMIVSEKKNVRVLNVEWSISKDGYIKPKLNLEPTKLSGVTISNVTAFNAKYIKDNILGPGAIIELVRSGDVIPHIVKVIKPATSNEPQMPIINYEWTDTKVDIVAVAETDEQKIKELTFFFKKLDIKNVDESTVRKMILSKMDTIPKIMNIKKIDLEKLEGFKERMVNKIYENIMERFKTINILDLMVASNVFGHGMGERKLKKIMDVYPDVIQLYTDYKEKDIISMIKEIDGFDIKTAEYFSDGLIKFIRLFNSLTEDMRKKLRISILDFIDKKEEKEGLKELKEQKETTDNKFLNKKFVFSDFRNKDWEKLIEANGGLVSSAISSKTSILVTTESAIQEGTNSKVVKAKELKIPILTKEQFQKQFIDE
jgi:NAD-dependent DNA ligase